MSNITTVRINDIGSEWSIIQVSNERPVGFFKTKAAVKKFCKDNGYYIDIKASSASWTYGRMK